MSIDQFVLFYRSASSWHPSSHHKLIHSLCDIIIFLPHIMSSSTFSYFDSFFSLQKIPCDFILLTAMILLLFDFIVTAKVVDLVLSSYDLQKFLVVSFQLRPSCKFYASKLASVSFRETYAGQDIFWR